MRKSLTMPIRIVALGAVLAAAAGVSVAWAEPDDPAYAGLAASLDTILGDSRLAGASAAVVVKDLDTGDIMYTRRGDDRFLPASNTKLLTSAAAMEILGPDYTFTTEVRAAEGSVRGPILTGPVYLRGTGDPTIMAADYDKLAADLAAQGIEGIAGELVADDTWFDTVRLGTEWGWSDESYYYAGQISALSVTPDTDYDTGSVVVAGTPAAAAGTKPTVTMTPPNGHLTIVNNATTVAAGGADTLAIEREHGTNRVLVTGQVPVGGSATSEWIAVDNPTGYALDIFKRALKNHGITFVGWTKQGVATPASASKVLASHTSMKLSQILVPFMKLSNNMHAEILTKAIGRKVSNAGTWPAGLAAIKAYTTGPLGMNGATYRQSDGSGLSRWDQIPSNEFIDLLTNVRSEPWFDAWYAALPVAGDPGRFVGGTLRSRMRNTPAAGNVHAKTGTLTGASALSGYVTDKDGHTLAFSIMLNNYLASSVKPIEDQIAVTLATFTRNPSIARPSVPTVPEVASPEGLECAWVKPIAC